MTKLGVARDRMGALRGCGRRGTASAHGATAAGMRAMRMAAVFLALLLSRPAGAQAPASPPPAAPLDSYADAAATTIIAEQSCPGVQVKAGQLTTLRLAAKVNAGQETLLQEKLRARATQIRQQLAADGREAWCAGALAAFGPQGSVARGILATGALIR